MAVEGHFVGTRLDYDGEASSYSARTTVLTAANFDAQHTLRIALTGAISGICGGNVMHNTESNVDVISTAPSDDPLDQRENKWLVRYRDATTDKLHKMELPCADLTKLDPNNRGFLDLDGTEGAAFVSAFEAYILAPDTGNAVEVQSVEFVGRNI